MGQKSIRFIVRGKVQGVWYRRSIEKNACSKGFSGYVRNMPDGSVEAAVTCDESKVEEFIAILRRGSPASEVESIEHGETADIFRGGFFVR